MAKIIERQFASKSKGIEIEEKKLQFCRHYKLADYMADLLYKEVKMKVVKGIDEEETRLFKLIGLDK